MPQSAARPSSGATPVDLSRCLNPRGVAIVGATNDLTRIGGQPIRLLTEFGYRGHVYPVNPRYSEIKGLVCYPELAAVPQPCDLALIALSARNVPAAIEHCGKAGIPYAIVLSAGFSEIGADGKALQEQLAAAIAGSGVRVVGPNCLGMLNLRDSVRVAFGGTAQLATLRPGSIAMVTQSGGFGFGAVAIACYYGLSFNYVISTGNEVDLTLLDWIADLIERPEVDMVAAFMEGITDGRRLLAIGERALELGKPILAWKVGNTATGRQAATSHTARMTAGYEFYRTAFRRGGFVEIRDVDDLVDVAKAFGIGKLPRGNRVAVLTLSGGAGVLLADRCTEYGLQLPPLAEETRKRLRETLVSFAAADNPIDATAHGYNDNFASYRSAVRHVLADPNIDQVIARAPRGTAARPWAEGLVEVLKEIDKPLILNWPTAPDDNAGVIEYLESNGVPCIVAPGRAAHALAAIGDFAAKKRAYARRQRATFMRPIAPQPLALPAGSTTLGEHRSKQLLAAYGVPTVGEVLLSPAAVAALTSCPLAFPVAVKIESPDVPHKTEAGAVRLNLHDLGSVKQAAIEVVAAARRHHPSAHIDGVLLQEMAHGLEVIVGTVNDPHFGPVVVFGPGGVLAELMGDIAHGFAPLDLDDAHAMIAQTRIAKLLNGYRGGPALDADVLAETLVRISLLAADHAGRIAEIDVNPLFVRPAGQGVVAADALVVLRAA